MNDVLMPPNDLSTNFRMVNASINVVPYLI